MIAGSSRSSSRSPNPVGRATSDLLHSLMLSIPGVKERVSFLTDFGVPLPEKREDDPEIYDFVRGKAPSPGALFQRLKDKLLPESYADMAEVFARMQVFFPDFVPTIQLESLPNRNWEPEE